MPELLSLKLDKIIFRKLINGVKDFQALSKAQTDWRLAHEHSIETKDLFASLMEAKDPETGNGLNEDQIVAETGSLLLAGSDTQATALAAALFYFLHYPATLCTLQDEIRTTFAEVEEIRIGKQLSSCRYLRACIDEALRLSPPIGGLLQREVLPGGLIVDGERIPAGVDIGVPHYAIHHNETYYPEPFSFRPERWIASSEPSDLGVPGAAVSLAQSAFSAFGVGRTSCVGKTLAYTEMSIILARMIWLYDLRLQSGSTLGEGSPRLGENRSRKDEFQTFDGFFSTHDGPLVDFKLRL
jgi:cytochrome P450